MDQSRTTVGRGRLYDSILDTIGDTPCVQVKSPGARGLCGSM